MASSGIVSNLWQEKRKKEALASLFEYQYWMCFFFDEICSKVSVAIFRLLQPFLR